MCNRKSIKAIYAWTLMMMDVRNIPQKNHQPSSSFHIKRTNDTGFYCCCVFKPSWNTIHPLFVHMFILFHESSQNPVIELWKPDMPGYTKYFMQWYTMAWKLWVIVAVFLYNSTTLPPHQTSPVLKPNAWTRSCTTASCMPLVSGRTFGWSACAGYAFDQNQSM